MLWMLANNFNAAWRLLTSLMIESKGNVFVEIGLGFDFHGLVEVQARA